MDKNVDRVGYIYGLELLSEPGRIRYIGQTVRTLKVRLSCHISDAMRVGSNSYDLPSARWIRKAVDNGDQVSIILVEEGTYQNLDQLEVAAIAKFRALGQADLNLWEGGKRNTHPVSAETRKKISDSKKGKPQPWNQGSKHPMYGKTGELSPSYGRVVSDDTRAKISAAHLGHARPWSESRRESAPSFEGSSNPFYGKKHSPESLAKMAEATRARNLGRCKLSSEQILELCALSRKGFKQRALGEYFDISQTQAGRILKKHKDACLCGNTRSSSI